MNKKEKANFGALRKITVGFAVLLLTVSVASFVSLKSKEGLLKSVELINHSLEVELVANQIATDFSIVEKAKGSFLLTHDLTFLKAFHEAESRVNAKSSILAALTQDNPSQQDRVAQFKFALEERLDHSRKIIRTFQARGLAAVLAERRAIHSYPAFGDIHEKIKSILAEEERLLVERGSSFKDFSSESNQALIVLVGIVFATCIGGFISVRRELTERVRLEMERDQFFENSIDLLCIAKTTGYFLRINAAFERTLGFSKDEMLTTPFFNFIHPDDIQRTKSELEKLKQGEPSFSFENRYRTKGGHYKTLAWRTFPVGEMLYANARDMTEQREMESRLLHQQKLAIASSKLSAIGELAGGMAHEINNPLAAIQAYVESTTKIIAKKDTLKKEAEIVKNLEEMSSSVFKISKLLASLRSFAQDHTQEKMKKVMLRVIVEDTLAFCRERFLTNSVGIEVSPIPDGLTLECHPTEISQVLLNLLNNAYDAVQDVPSKKIELNIKNDGLNCEISVTDSGVGIPPSVQEKLFQPFFTTKDIGKGTGLGLSISKGIIEKHGGNIFLDETSAKTRFVIRLKSLNQEVHGRS